jgi:hypothetical protein
MQAGLAIVTKPKLTTSGSESSLVRESKKLSRKRHGPGIVNEFTFPCEQLLSQALEGPSYIYRVGLASTEVTILKDTTNTDFSSSCMWCKSIQPLDWVPMLHV